ncbi:unnamed protein product [Rhodiola kirilowii]
MIVARGVQSSFWIGFAMVQSKSLYCLVIMCALLDLG